MAKIISINISPKKGMRKKAVDAALLKENYGIDATTVSRIFLAWDNLATPGPESGLRSTGPKDFPAPLFWNMSAPVRFASGKTTARSCIPFPLC